MKKILPAVLILIGCNSYNDKMNSLLRQKSTTEDSMAAYAKRTGNKHSINIEFSKEIDTAGSFQREINENRKMYARQAVLDSFKREIDKINYSIDSLEKLK